MVGESIVLTKELVARAALFLIRMVSSSEKYFADYENQGLGVCVIHNKKVLYERSLKVEKWPPMADFYKKAEKLARMVSREKKNSKNLFLTPAKFKEEDYKELGGIWSSECNIGIGVQGFLEKTINDEVARHLLIRIKALVDIEFARIMKNA